MDHHTTAVPSLDLSPRLSIGPRQARQPVDNLRHPSEYCSVDRIFSFERHNRCPPTQQSSGYDHVHPFQQQPPRHCGITVARKTFPFSILLSLTSSQLPFSALVTPRADGSFGPSVSQLLCVRSGSLQFVVSQMSPTPSPSPNAAFLDSHLSHLVCFFIHLHLGLVNSLLLYSLETVSLTLSVSSLCGPHQIDCFTPLL